MTDEVRFSATLDGAWRGGVPFVCIGPTTSDASIYVLVTRDHEPLVAVAIAELRSAIHVFREALVWADNLVIGFGEAVHIVSLTSHAVASHYLDGYFGHLYATRDVLLVADASYLWRMNPDGSVAWRSNRLAVDGVVVSAVEDDVVRCEGQYDPPDGWERFRLALATGRAIPD